MTSAPSRSIYLKDYAPPAWLIDSVDLHVAIRDGWTEVRKRYGVGFGFVSQQPPTAATSGASMAKMRIRISRSGLDCLLQNKSRTMEGKKMDSLATLNPRA